MTIYDIRKQLQSKNIPEHEIKEIIRVIDNYVMNQALAKATTTKIKEIYWVGVALTSIGVTITFGSLLGILSTGNSFIIAYGPLLGGLSTIIYCKTISKRQRGNINR